MKRVCAWCSRELGTDTNDAIGSPIEGHNKMEDVSHGICTECLEKRNQEIEKFKKLEENSTRTLSDDELRSFVATAILKQYKTDDLKEVYDIYKDEFTEERIRDLLQKNSEAIGTVSSNLRYVIENLLTERRHLKQ